MTVEEIQRRLNSLGFDAGPEDGKLGQRTRDAIRAFQKKHGLLPDGIIGPVTTGALTALMPTIPGASPPASPDGAGRPIHTLVWHCTATTEGQEFTLAQIDKMHRERGFSKIGYHKLIHLDGTVDEGRPESEIGAHVSGHNRGTIGYSYVGGVDAAGKAKDTRTAAQKATMTRLTEEAIKRNKLRAVLGHRDLSPDTDNDGVVEPHEWVKQCPCFNAISEYGALLR